MEAAAQQPHQKPQQGQQEQDGQRRAAADATGGARGGGGVEGGGGQPQQRRTLSSLTDDIASDGGDSKQHQQQQQQQQQQQMHQQQQQQEGAGPNAKGSGPADSETKAGGTDADADNQGSEVLQVLIPTYHRLQATDPHEYLTRVLQSIAAQHTDYTARVAAAQASHSTAGNISNTNHQHVGKFKARRRDMVVVVVNTGPAEHTGVGAAIRAAVQGSSLRVEYEAVLHQFKDPYPPEYKVKVVSALCIQWVVWCVVCALISPYSSTSTAMSATERGSPRWKPCDSPRRKPAVPTMPPC
jgi:hypothetical protein